jgi:quercetin dioxygenase-like cupin family protein
MSNIAFETIDWADVEKVAYRGETGTAYWQTKMYDGLRVRRVEYSENYIADHWCKKGHIVHCLEGEFVSELEDGKDFILTKGMTYIVSDEMSSHKSIAKNGVKLLIIDGDFLKYSE